MKIEVMGLLEMLSDHMKSARKRRDDAIRSARAAYERLEARQPGDLSWAAAPEDSAAAEYSRAAELAHRELVTLERIHVVIQELLAREMQTPTHVRVPIRSTAE